MKKKENKSGCRPVARPIYIIERELREAMDKAAEFLRRGNYARHQQSLQQAERLKIEYDNAMRDIQFDIDNRNMGKAERSFFAKMLCLQLNGLELVEYHQDIYKAYMQNRGYIPVEEWSRLERELKRITRKYRDYLFKFFHTNRLKDESSESFVILHDIVRDKLFYRP